MYGLFAFVVDVPSVSFRTSESQEGKIAQQAQSQGIILSANSGGHPIVFHLSGWVFGADATWLWR